MACLAIGDGLTWTWRGATASVKERLDRSGLNCRAARELRSECALIWQATLAYRSQRAWPMGRRRGALGVGAAIRCWVPSLTPSRDRITGRSTVGRVVPWLARRATESGYWDTSGLFLCPLPLGKLVARRGGRCPSTDATVHRSLPDRVQAED